MEKRGTAEMFSVGKGGIEAEAWGSFVGSGLPDNDTLWPATVVVMVVVPWATVVVPSAS